MNEPTLAQIIRYGADAFVRLANKASAAEEVQWERSPLTGRTQGHEYADPVLDTVVDPRRLAVREAYEKARRALLELAEAAREAGVELDTALGNWEGK